MDQEDVQVLNWVAQTAAQRATMAIQRDIIHAQLAKEFPEVVADDNLVQAALYQAAKMEREELAGKQPPRDYYTRGQEALKIVSQYLPDAPAPARQSSSAPQSRESGGGRAVSARTAPSNSNRPESASTNLHVLPAEHSHSIEGGDPTERFLEERRGEAVAAMRRDRTIPRALR